MKLIRPVIIDESVVTACNVAEDDYPAYVDSATYKQGDRVIMTSTHRVYECLQDDVSSISPDASVDSANPQWIEVSATNPWRMFDLKMGSITLALEQVDADHLIFDDSGQGISITLEPGSLVDGLALFGLWGVYLNVTVETRDGVIYQRRQALSGGVTSASWYSYFFDPLERYRQVVLTDLPTGLDARIRVAVISTGTNAEIAQMVLGRVNRLGWTKYGSGIGIKDYSVKERDSYGQITLRERDYSRRAEIDYEIDNADISSVDRILTEVRAKPTVYIANDNIDAMVVFGYYSDWFITVSNPVFSDATLQLEGLT